MADPGAVPLRSELVRAYSRLFGTRGGFSPAAFKEVMPVTIMDTPSWPASRRWMTSESNPGGAATNAVVQFENSDPLDSGSLVVLDYFRIIVGTATDVIMEQFPVGQIAYAAGPFASIDVAPPPGATTVQTIANVRHGNNAVVPPFTTGYRFFAVPANTPFEMSVQLPEWTLTPQVALIFAAVTVNIPMSVTFGGRYYSAL